MKKNSVKVRGDSISLRDLTNHPSVDSKKEYKQELEELQLAMLRIQQNLYRNGGRAVLVFEGWDAGGKGGSIRRLTECLDPRGVRAHAIAAPTPAEQGRHYLWRFWRRVPEPGRISVFDRSWYGRVLVERVEGLAEEAAWKRAYSEINDFEHVLLDDGVRIVKFFLHITPDEQLRRFSERLENPYKRWKLTDEDIRNRKRWNAYERAIEDMVKQTSTVRAPWNVIEGDHKWHARLEILRRTVATLGQGLDLELPAVPPERIKALRQALEGLS